MGLFRPYGLSALALTAALAAAAPGVDAKSPPRLLAGDTTAFDNEEFIAFAVTGVDDSCELLWTFTNSISTAPTHGSATAGQAVLPYGELCPGKVFPHAVVKYTWTDTGTAVQDTLVTDVKYPTDTRPVTVNIKRGSIVVKDVNLMSGVAIIDLNAGSDTKGTVTFEFVGGAGKSTWTTATEITPGTGRGVTIDRTKITKGKYTKVNVKWNTSTLRYGNPVAVKHTLQNTFTPAKPWNVLGVIRYSQYNVPIESECVGKAVASYVVDSLKSCTFTATTFKSDFLSQTKVNGTGQSVTYSYIKPGWNTDMATSCAGKFPDGADVNNSWLQMSSVIGSCNMQLIANTSVATKPKNCASDQQLVKTDNANFGIKNSDDTCPGCDKDFNGTDGHIDSFTNIAKCKPRDILDLGNFWTLRRP